MDTQEGDARHGEGAGGVDLHRRQAWKTALEHIEPKGPTKHNRTRYQDDGGGSKSDEPVEEEPVRLGRCHEYGDNWISGGTAKPL